MKVVILAGGYGTRISEESYAKPKPMITIGEMPILLHIMKIYSYYGYNDFVICCGYKGSIIKEYFANYFLYTSDVTFDFINNNNFIVHNSISEPWKVTLIDTGIDSMTGGRIKRIQPYIPNGESFMLTYGDGVSDVNIMELENYHKKQKKLATLTAIQPIGKFGALNIDDKGIINNFEEKPKSDGSWINGGFFVLDYSVFEYLEGDDTVFEREPLEKLAFEGELVAFKHRGFWKAMDTIRDRDILEDLWKNNIAPWKVWN